MATDKPAAVIAGTQREQSRAPANEIAWWGVGKSSGGLMPTIPQAVDPPRLPPQNRFHSRPSFWIPEQLLFVFLT